MTMPDFSNWGLIRAADCAIISCHVDIARFAARTLKRLPFREAFCVSGWRAGYGDMTGLPSASRSMSLDNFPDYFFIRSMGIFRVFFGRFSIYLIYIDYFTVNHRKTTKNFRLLWFPDGFSARLSPLAQFVNTISSDRMSREHPHGRFAGVCQSVLWGVPIGMLVQFMPTLKQVA
jgi:hypothetical protein